MTNIQMPDQLPNLFLAAVQYPTGPEQMPALLCAVLPYVSADRREGFAQVLSDCSTHRKLVWLSNEAPGVLPHVDVASTSADRLQFLIGRSPMEPISNGWMHEEAR